MTDSADDQGPDVGSLAEEATKLLGALNGWAREHGEGFTGVGEHVAAAAHDLNDHIATGSAECSVCPICRTVHAARQLSPEVKEHLAAAAASLMQAAAGVLATVAPHEEDRDRGGVEHINLDESSEEWPDEERP